AWGATFSSSSVLLVRGQFSFRARSGQAAVELGLLRGQEGRSQALRPPQPAGRLGVPARCRIDDARVQEQSGVLGSGGDSPPDLAERVSGPAGGGERPRVRVERE